jgi:hypothetical protein
MKGIDMFPSPMDFSEALHIGTVEFVSPNEIRVSLDIEAPESVALNTGTPRPFPRVNGYVLIPSDQGYLVGQIEWLTIEESAYPKRRGLKDFGLIDLPYPKRKMSLNPLGDLIKKTDDKGDESYQFERGVESFPSVGDAVLLPTETQLHSIVESGQERKVKIGTSPLAGDAEVFVDPDRLFGRHLAVLGNTGSGKSCSVAGLIRWCLNAASEQTSKNLNARFIILDPNGEYERAFGGEKGILKPRVFKVGDEVSDSEHLQVPMWFWNSSEWCAFAKASPKAQRPVLLHALRMVNNGEVDLDESPSHEVRMFLRTVVTIIRSAKNNGTPWADFPKNKNFFEKIRKLYDGGLAQVQEDTFSDEEKHALSQLSNFMKQLVDARSGEYPHFDFTFVEIKQLLSLSENAHRAFGGLDSDFVPFDIDTPRPFSSDSLLKCLEASAEILDLFSFVDTMMLRIRTMLNDAKMQAIIDRENSIEFQNWLVDYIGESNNDVGAITIIDLSLIPSEVVNVITAIIARIIFEALQRYRKWNSDHKVLPTVMIMEEAHTYVKKYSRDSSDHDTSRICCEVFERIAREGRKFGLGLVLSSQRPSELSSTVLSQCNTFLLHRISNDRDQDLVNRYVPDNLKGLLNDLPSLPSQNAILLGWASELPVLVRMNDLPKEHQPQSDDPDFWDVWTGKKERNVDWGEIADIWQQKLGQ